jgi:hypothetical protein
LLERCIKSGVFSNDFSNKRMENFVDDYLEGHSKDPQTINARISPKINEDDFAFQIFLHINLLATECVGEGPNGLPGCRAGPRHSGRTLRACLSW